MDQFLFFTLSFDQIITIIFTISYSFIKNSDHTENMTISFSSYEDILVLSLSSLSLVTTLFMLFSWLSIRELHVDIRRSLTYVHLSDLLSSICILSSLFLDYFSLNSQNVVENVIVCLFSFLPECIAIYCSLLQGYVFQFSILSSYCWIFSFLSDLYTSCPPSSIVSNRYRLLVFRITTNRNTVSFYLSCFIPLIVTLSIFGLSFYFSLIDDYNGYWYGPFLVQSDSIGIG